MVKLMDHLERLSRAQTLLGAAALLAAVSLWALDLRASAHQAAVLNAHVMETRAKWQTRSLRSEAARTALDEAMRISATVQSIAPRISPELLTTELTALARSTGVRRLSIQNSLTASFHSLADCPVVLDFQGDLPTVMRFLRDAETGDRPARLQSMKMKTIDAGQTQFEVQASLDFYGTAAP
jgi:hypothetical protein